jgi:hypothetical protein
VARFTRAFAGHIVRLAGVNPATTPGSPNRDWDPIHELDQFDSTSHQAGDEDHGNHEGKLDPADQQQAVLS